MKFKRMTALLLCCFLLLSLLSGCADRSAEQGNLITYIPTFHKLKDEIRNVSQACSSEDMMYFIGYVPGEKEAHTDQFTGETFEYDTEREALFRIALDGTGLEELTGFVKSEIPEDREGDAYINSMSVGPDGALWVLENVNTYYYDLPENFDPMTGNMWEYFTEDRNRVLARKLGPDGKELFSVDLCEVAAQVDKTSDEDGRNYYIYEFCLDRSGNLYFWFYGEQGTTVVLDPAGNVLMTLESDSGDRMVRLNDGRVALLSYQDGSMALLPIDLEAKAFGDPLTTPADSYNFYSGSGDFLYFYSTSSSVMGCKEDGTIEKLFTWINCDLSQDELRGITVCSQDRAVAMRNDWSSETPTNELVVLDRTEVTPENQRKTLTLAVMWLSYDLRNIVLDYNRSNTEYRIEVQDYSEYNTQDDYNAGMTKLTTEIISGKVPDIFVADGMPLEQYGAKGLLEDLLPYIDSDEELGGRESIVQPLLNAMMQEGKLYQVASRFSVNTATTSKRLVGDITGWTVDEARAALAKLPEDATLMSLYTTQSDLLNLVCQWNLDSYVDWNTGDCFFDTGDFEKLLEFSTLVKDEINWNGDEMMDYNEEEYIRSGMQLMTVQTFNDWWSLLYQQAYWGEDVLYVGFPSDDRQGSAFSVNNGLAMSSRCQHKDAAWQFLRKMLTGENDYGWGFPVSQSAFDEHMEQAMTPDSWTDENGNVIEYPKIEYTDQNGETVKIMAMSQESYDQFMDLLNNTFKMTNYDESIMEIVMSEAAPFLAGKASAQKVADLVQSKVRLYVNEHR